MNEIINKLIDEANQDLDGINNMPMFDSSYNQFLEKFTELVIRECNTGNLK